MIVFNVPPFSNATKQPPVTPKPNSLQPTHCYIEITNPHPPFQQTTNKQTYLINIATMSHSLISFLFSHDGASFSAMGQLIATHADN